MGGFKQKDFYYKSLDLITNTLELSDIISNSTYNETAKHIYANPMAQQIGRCFSYHNNEEIELNTGKPFFFKTASDLKIFIHPKGDELWFTGFYEFPYEVAFITLDFTQRINFGLAITSLREIKSVQYPKPEMPCKNYGEGADNDHELFAKCCRENLWRSLPASITCTIPDMNQFIPKNSTMSECSKVDEATKVYWEFLGFLQKSMPIVWKFGCPIPCKQTFFQTKLDYFHKNNAFLPENFANPGEGHFTFYPYLSAYPIEEKIEKLEYDLTSFLVSAGGSLGLFLGFSCLSILFGMIEFIQARF